MEEIAAFQDGRVAADGKTLHCTVVAEIKNGSDDPLANFDLGFDLAFDFQ